MISGCCDDLFCPGIVLLNEDINGYLVINENAGNIDTKERNIVTDDGCCISAAF